MKHALVTGGFGFIGSHLVSRLLEEGTRVTVVDSLLSSAIDPDAFMKRCPAGLSEYRTTIRGFLRDHSSRPRFDEIYHLASIVGPVGVLLHAGRIAPSVLRDTEGVIGLALDDRARLCNVSTSEIYGGGHGGLCAENDVRVVPAKATARLEYAVAKLAAEISIANVAQSSGLHAINVRPFNVAGPRQSARGGFVIPRFLQQAIKSQPLTVYGDGSAVRAFTHVTDIVEGIVAALRNGKSGEAYNLGNPLGKTTILELAHRVNRIVGVPMDQIEFVDPVTLWGPEFAEAADKFPDATRAFEELGWRPSRLLDRTIMDARDYIEAGRQD